MKSCDSLSAEERAVQLSQHMIVFKETVRLKSAFTSRARTPGFCVLCGAKLPVTWRAVKCLEPSSEACPEGRFTCVEATHEAESLAGVEAFRKKHEADGWGLRAGYVLAPVTACASVTEKVFSAAQALALQRHRALLAANAPEQPQQNKRSRLREHVSDF